jgi:hypothetical protein
MLSHLSMFTNSVMRSSFSKMALADGSKIRERPQGFFAEGVNETRTKIVQRISEIKDN